MQKKMTKRRKALRRELKGLAFVAPAFIGLLVFTLYPMVNAVINSLYNWNMGGRSAKKFVGLYNYRKLFRNDEIYLILSNTLRYVLYILPFILVFGFLLGVLLQKKSKLNVVFRTLIYTPHVASMVGLSVVWLYIFNPQYGILNAALSAVGLRPLRWINDTSTAHMSIVIVTIWRTLFLFISCATTSKILTNVNGAFEIGLTSIMKDQTKSIGLGAYGLSIFKDTNEKATMSAEFIRFMTLPENAIRTCLAKPGPLPFTKTQMADETIMARYEDPYNKAVLAQSDYIQGEGVTPVDAIVWNEIVTLMSKIEADPDLDLDKELSRIQTEMDDYMMMY